MGHQTDHFQAFGSGSFSLCDRRSPDQEQRLKTLSRMVSEGSTAYGSDRHSHGALIKPRNALSPFELCCCTALVGLLGCASLGRPLPERKPTDVYASFSKTWGATVEYLERSGRSVDTTDRSSGIIRADATTIPSDKSYFGSCGNSRIEHGWRGTDGGWESITHYEGPPIGAPFTAIVQGDRARATVTVTAEWIDSRGKEVLCSPSSKTWWEKGSEEAIRKIAETR